MFSDDFSLKLQTHYLEALPSILEELEYNALTLEKSGFQHDIFFALFRQIHSLKGSGGTFGFPIISTVCHQFEDYLTFFKEQTKLEDKDTSKILSYVDLLKKTYQELCVNAQEFKDIEAELQNLLPGKGIKRLRGLIIDSSNINMSMIENALDEKKPILVHMKDGLNALSRLLHEPFDFLITSKENVNLNGPALIAAAKLGSTINKHIPMILLTSDKKPLETSIVPDKIILKDQQFLESITEFVNKLDKQ